ncbi:MAG TPA: MBL fold metallo-hydrolase [Methylomirabilota bacterium]|nr:MBL fold metallo-hydrolase [Methylomirabilota bacterium]
MLVSLLAVGVVSLQAELAKPKPAHHVAQGFRNLDNTYDYSMGQRARRLLRRVFFESWPERGTAPTVLPNNGADLRANGIKPTVTWIGHATLLVQLAGVNVLTDPHWGERASPVSFAGPRRMVAPGLRFEDLPPIHAVVISHDHYDHLDVDTVLHLARTFHPRFFVPLGLKAWFGDLGIRDVVELDWWESVEFRGLTLTCTPAQHSSGRGLRDQNLRLWSSWVVAAGDKRFYFAGDTGYTKSLAEIGARLGPFDFAAIPIGGYSAYDTKHPNHVNPEEALQLFEDVGARHLVPIHFGTFDMNREPFAEPPGRLMKAAVARGLEERMALLSPGQSIHW